MGKTITSGRDLLSKKDGDSASDQTDIDTADPLDEKLIPTPDELSEVHTPELSIDTFTIAGKTFQLKLSNIKTQKMMAKSLTAINDLIAKTDVYSLVKSFRDKMRASDKDVGDRLSKIADMDEKDSAENILLLVDEIDSGSDFYIDLVEIVKDIIQYGGIDNIIITVMDLMVGVVYAICCGQDNEVTRDWIEENIAFAQAQDIFFKQMKKDEIQGRAIDFLALSIRLITQKDRDE